MNSIHSSHNLMIFFLLPKNKNNQTMKVKPEWKYFIYLLFIGFHSRRPKVSNKYHLSPTFILRLYYGSLYEWLYACCPHSFQIDYYLV